ncbi:MAG: dienelactone hydrolase family protein [Verrucomicrobiae bacterium]|nr:dienelactone hydrolase family protein [Verrucomicrobiae bacterium]
MKAPFLFIFFFLTVSSYSELIKKNIAYEEGGTKMEGYLVYDDAQRSKRPGILVLHDWMGIGEFSKKKAEQLADLGYVAFAADIYGIKNRPENAKEAGAISGQLKADRQLLRSRVLAALKVLQNQSEVDSDRMAAIGYCFGGTTVLELARSGANVAGVVSFHGGLDSPVPSDAKQIKSKVLVLHGADDPLVSADEVAAFQKEMRDAKVDWQMVSYGNAGHAFTYPKAASYGIEGVAYDELADKRSWKAMKVFFKELFQK